MGDDAQIDDRLYIITKLDSSKIREESEQQASNGKWRIMGDEFVLP